MSLIQKVKTTWSKRLVHTADCYLLSLAGFHSQGHSPDDVIRKCRLAIRLTPDYPLAYLVLGNGLYATNCYEEATVQYKKALELDPDLYFAQLLLAKVLHMSADLAAEKQNDAQARQLYNEALLCYHKASALDEEDRKTHAFGVNQILRALGNYDK